MSHINDLICVLRGLRLVLESGVKVQQEASRVIWNNSTLKSALQAMPTNPFTAVKPNPDITKYIVERALVVAQGFRQYTVMHIPNFNTDTEIKADMDPQTRDEIDELNREFNRTFESLKKTQNDSGYLGSTDEYVSSLETLETDVYKGTSKSSMHLESTTNKLMVQPEASLVIWNRSSSKSALQMMLTKPFTAVIPYPDITKSSVERALVVAQGFRQYALMHYKHTQTRDEIDELNKELDKIFENLKKTQND